MGRYLDIAKAVADDLDGYGGYELNELNEKSPPNTKQRSEAPALAGIMSDIPPFWEQGVAVLFEVGTPEAYPDEQWEVLRRDAYSFLRTWGAQAHRLGWMEIDLFAVHRTQPWQRLDSMGLIPLLGGRSIVAMTENKAAIKTATGGTLTYYRRRPPYPGEVCLVWDLK